MVRAKGGACDDCCCAVCGVRPRGDAKGCCYCLPDELCITLLMTDEASPCDSSCQCSGADCPCVRGRGLLTWDPENCWWSGSIACQSVTIGVQVEVFNCDGTCYVCVTSGCMGMAGDCDTTVDCFALDSCGVFGKDCDVAGGFTVNFQKDISGCKAECDTADITITASSFINPNYDPVENYEICRDCNCVCEYVCITYSENGCEIKKLVQWDDLNNWWQTTFDGDCAWAAQTVTVTLVADDDGCCKWSLSTTRGTVDAPNPVDHECPHPTLSWTLSGLTNASVTLECSVCDKCEVASCCPVLPTTLYARICTLAPCASTQCIELELVGRTATTAVWRSSAGVTMQCRDALPPNNCFDIDIDQIEFECLNSGTLFALNAYCNGNLVGGTNPTVDCTPFCADTGVGGFPWSGSEVDCNWQGSGAGCIDNFYICVSEEPCP